MTVTCCRGLRTPSQALSLIIALRWEHRRSTLSLVLSSNATTTKKLGRPRSGQDIQTWAIRTGSTLGVQSSSGKDTCQCKTRRKVETVTCRFGVWSIGLLLDVKVGRQVPHVDINHYHRTTAHTHPRLVRKSAKQQGVKLKPGVKLLPCVGCRRRRDTAFRCPRSPTPDQIRKTEEFSLIPRARSL